MDSDGALEILRRLVEAAKAVGYWSNTEVPPEVDAEFQSAWNECSRVVHEVDRARAFHDAYRGQINANNNLRAKVEELLAERTAVERQERNAVE